MKLVAHDHSMLVATLRKVTRRSGLSRLPSFQDLQERMQAQSEHDSNGKDWDIFEMARSWLRERERVSVREREAIVSRPDSTS